MFILDGKPQSPDVAFTHAGVQYPVNWIRLSSPAERETIGITEVPDPPSWDQRFYWGVGIPKDHTQLVEQWTSATRTTAGTLLAPSDWLVVREIDNGTVVPEDWRTWREAIRTATGAKVAAIEATLDTPELAEYLTGTDYPTWPVDPNAPVVLPVDDGMELDFNGGVTGGVIL